MGMEVYIGGGTKPSTQLKHLIMPKYETTLMPLFGFLSLISILTVTPEVSEKLWSVG